MTTHKRKHRAKVHHLRMTCPICGSVNVVDVTMNQLREFYRQDYPVFEIFNNQDPVQLLPLLGGICPGCWTKITRHSYVAQDDERPVKDQDLVDAIMIEGRYGKKDRITGLVNKRIIAIKAGKLIPPEVKERIRYYKREAALANGQNDPFNNRIINWSPTTPEEKINPFMLPD